jgi:hypothetical protein
MLNSIRLAKNKFITLDTYRKDHYPTRSMQFHNTFIAILLGVGLGTLGSIAAQKEMNKHTASQCYGPADQVVPIRSFIGTVNFCVKGGTIK